MIDLGFDSWSFTLGVLVAFITSQIYKIIKMNIEEWMDERFRKIKRKGKKNGQD